MQQRLRYYKLSNLANKGDNMEQITDFETKINNIKAIECVNCGKEVIGTEKYRATYYYDYELNKWKIKCNACEHLQTNTKVV